MQCYSVWYYQAIKGGVMVCHKTASEMYLASCALSATPAPSSESERSPLGGNAQALAVFGENVRSYATALLLLVACVMHLLSALARALDVCRFGTVLSALARSLPWCLRCS